MKYKQKQTIKLQTEGQNPEPSEMNIMEVNHNQLTWGKQGYFESAT